jgi:hypothetical protein
LTAQTKTRWEPPAISGGKAGLETISDSAGSSRNGSLVRSDQGSRGRPKASARYNDGPLSKSARFVHHDNKNLFAQVPPVNRGVGSNQNLRVIEKRADGTVSEEDVMPILFAPMTGKAAE